MAQTVLILLSTYNGTDYLIQQLESIRALEGVTPHLMVRDDGSTNPRTMEILSHASQHMHIELVRGENVGAADSYMQLIAMAPEYDYYAFCDQDDVWLPEKLIRGVEALKQVDADMPALYGCNYNICNAEGHITHPAVNHHRVITKGGSLIESWIPGCTMVFNHALLTLTRRYMPPADRHLIHDRWMFLLATFFGQVVYDERAGLNYRLHGNNVVGTLVPEEKKQRLKRISTPSSMPVWAFAQTMFETCGKDMDEHSSRLLDTCARYTHSLACRLRMAFSSEYRLTYGSLTRRLYWKYRILTKKI